MLNMFSLTAAVVRVCEFLEVQVDVWSLGHPLDSIEDAVAAAGHKNLDSFLRSGISERLRRTIGAFSAIQVVCNSHQIIPLHLSDLGAFGSPLLVRSCTIE